MTTAVAIALYNGEKFICKQLESIRTQTKAPDQVVLCDDGSTDSTVTIVREYIQAHHLQDSWNLVINESNLGYARNFFKAMSLCEADLVFLADQDDIWKQNKIEEMSRVMEKRPDIALLSCKFEIMDADDQIMHGLLARRPKETLSLKQVATEDLLRGFYWLGMLMCVRTSFLREILPVAADLPIAHDRVLAHCAAERGLFYDYDYIGAYHRRHGNNTAREEHRITKLLNLPKKIKEIAVTKKLFSDIQQSDLPIGQENRMQISHYLELLDKRDAALRSKSLKAVLQLYKEDAGKYLRKMSMLCDIWLVCFGKPEK